MDATEFVQHLAVRGSVAADTLDSSFVALQELYELSVRRITKDQVPGALAAADTSSWCLSRRLS